MPRPEVVVTGLGVVSPIGVGAPAFWESLLAGKSGVAKIAAFPTAGLSIGYGGEVKNFDAKPHVAQRKSLKVMSRAIQMGVAAADLGLKQAGLPNGQVDPTRIGCEFGAQTIQTELPDVIPAYRASLAEGQFTASRWGRSMTEMNPLWMLKYLPNMPACHVGINWDARGPSNTIVHGDASSLLALAGAVRQIERDAADVMVAGGADSRLHPKDWASLLAADPDAKAWSDPAAASRPFDAQRTGQVHGEGAGVLILERREHAAARGAKILARVIGVGAGGEGRRAGKTPTGQGVRNAINAALRDAGISAADVGHVNAHGAGTIRDDQVEAQAIRAVLGDVPVFAPKSYFGNLGAGSGMVEAVASVLALEHGMLPATLNYETPDPACPINVVRGAAQKIERPIAICINTTPAGQAAAVVIAR